MITDPVNPVDQYKLRPAKAVRGQGRKMVVEALLGELVHGDA